MRVGVIGLGKVAQLHHLPALAAHADFIVDAVCDWSLELTERIGDQYAVGLRTQNLDHLLAADLDVLVVSNRDHLAPVVAALESGLTVFVEKPLAWSHSEAKTIKETVARTHGRLMVGYMKLADPTVRALGSWVASQKLLLVRVTNRAGGRHKLERLYSTLRPDDLSEETVGREHCRIAAVVRETLGSDEPRRVSAYLTLLELASHDLNLIRYLLGDDVLVDYSRAIDRDGVTVYDIGLRAGGVPVRLECLASFTSRRTWSESMTAYGIDASATISFPSPFLREGSASLHAELADTEAEQVSTSLYTHQSPYRLQLDYLKRLAMHGEPAPCDATSAARDIDLVTEIVRHLDRS